MQTLLLIQSIFVYGLIIFLFMHAGYYTYKQQFPNGYTGGENNIQSNTSFTDLVLRSDFLIPILVFCFFAAIREKVGGVDNYDYEKFFYDIYNYGKIQTEDDIEYGYQWIIKLTTQFTNKHYLYFFIISLIQISLLYCGIRKESYLLIFFGLTFFLCNTFHSMLHIMRQYTVVCLFVAMTPYIQKKKNWIWIIPIILLGMTIHRTAILMIPLGIIGYLLKDKFLNPYIQLAILFICYLLIDKIDMHGWMNFYNLGYLSEYDADTINHYSEYSIQRKTFGARSHILLISYIVMAFYSKKMKEYYNNTCYNYIYNIFFWGICFYLLFYNNYVVIRLLHYSIIFSPIVQAYFLFYLWNNREKDKNNITVFILFILLLFAHMLFYVAEALAEYPHEFFLYKFHN